MKDALKRVLGLTQEPAQAEAVAEVVSTVIAESLNVTDATAGLTATIAELTEQLASANSQIAELSALVEAATEFKAAQEKAAYEAKIAARTVQVQALVGTEQAANLQSVIASLDETSFAAVVTAMSFKSDAEAKSTAFVEAGVDGSADTAKVAADAQSNRVKDYLKSIVQETQAN